ncbi:NAD(P)H-binding protein [Conexibacter sp. W3-3-2]|uniref:SDR family oxidoreductase n=1 Tax=Conexibacter sp. W3-3-2 TaxID=2675227 RepID=UPI0012B76D14|nr:SDR family oxidoreductase [Conexibacter sp. W3-3-2]MTD44522.1 NAD(P)H-binding protein [Conexibacter sp. W3-3-2]
MEIVIAGAHGQIGRRLTRQLAGRGDRVHGIIRNPDHAADVEADGGVPVVLDLERADHDAVTTALAGADAVVFAAGAGPGSGAERKLTVDRDAAILLLDATVRAGVGRYLIVSSVGTEDPPSGDDVFAVYLRAKAEADAAVMASELDWLVVRPGRLTDDDGTGLVRLDAEPHRGEVPREDVATVLAALLATPALRRRVLYLNGGEQPVAAALAALHG